MLLELQIENFVIIRKERISFSPGMNVVSGASGAGKSILVKALKLLSGERAALDLVGPWGGRSVVEGVFRIDPELLEPVINEAAPLAADENGELVALRLLDASGENRCYLNGRAVTLQSFRSVMEPLMEIAGQEGLSILSQPETRTDILDRYGGCEKTRNDYSLALHEAKLLRERLDALRSGAADRRERLDLITFQLDELHGLAIIAGETVRLEEEHRLLSNLHRIREVAERAGNDLYEGDSALADRLGEILRSIESLDLASSSRVARSIEALGKAVESVEEAAFNLRDLLGELNADPDRLEQVEQRLDQIHTMLRRYGPTEADLLDITARLEEERAGMSTEASSIEEIEAQLEERSRACLDLGNRLHRARLKAGQKLSREVNTVLGSLQMEEVTFQAGPLDLPEENALASATKLGLSRVDFLAATNRGMKPGRVDRIASGGERSRILLALLSSVGSDCGTPIMVFDEIDENVGSRLGLVVGRILKKLSREHQVITVTHIAPIAAMGEIHHKVEKSTAEDATMVAVRRLDDENRVQELAEMLAGPSPSREVLQEAYTILNMEREQD